MSRTGFRVGEACSGCSSGCPFEALRVQAGEVCPGSLLCAAGGATQPGLTTYWGTSEADGPMRLAESVIQAVLILTLSLCVSMLAVPTLAHSEAPAQSAVPVVALSSAHAGHPARASEVIRSSGPAMKGRGGGKKCCPNCDDDGMRPGCCTLGHCGTGAALLPAMMPQAALLVSGGAFLAMPTALAVGITPDLPSPPPR